MDIDVAQQARGHHTVQPDEPFRRVPWNGTRINRAGRHSRSRRDEKFRGRELIELTDDAVAGGSGETDGGDQRRHADHDAKHRQRHARRPRDHSGDCLGDQVAHRDPRRRNAHLGWRLADAWSRSPPRSLPSFMLTRREPRRATFSSCVTTTIVMPSLLSSVKKSRIDSVFLESRLPVGSSH